MCLGQGRLRVHITVDLLCYATKELGLDPVSDKRAIESKRDFCVCVSVVYSGSCVDGLDGNKTSLETVWV